MEITRHKPADLLILRLDGRLDANWCGHVQDALAAAVKEGEHRIHLDMGAVDYLSSAGIRVLLTFYKQLQAISGAFGIVNPSKVVRTVLDLAGLGVLIASAAPAAVPVAGETRAEDAESRTTESAEWKVYSTASSSPMRLAMTGAASVFAGGAALASAQPRAFGEGTVAIGVGTLGVTETDHASRAGEFLALSGVAAFQPADGSSNRPDFMVTEGALAPQGRLLLGIVGDGDFTKFLRFDAIPEARSVGMTELAQTALEVCGSSAAVVVGITETMGLVGAMLRRSPAASVAEGGPADGSPAGRLGARFAFPEIREWLSFTSERAFRDSASLIVGIVARPGSSLDPLLRPLAGGSNLVGHFHAAAFPYRPLRKGRIELKLSVMELFEGQPPQAILHLLADSRGFNGAGESEFFRGALWAAPATIP